MKKAILLSVFMLSSISASGQTGQEGLRSFKRGAAITLFAGVGGGILGLSTLSFYGEPQNHTGNIMSGALLGVAAGLGYVLWENSRPAETSSWTLLATPRGEPVLAFQLEF